MRLCNGFPYVPPAEPVSIASLDSNHGVAKASHNFHFGWNRIVEKGYRLQVFLDLMDWIVAALPRGLFAYLPSTADVIVSMPGTEGAARRRPQSNYGTLFNYLSREVTAEQSGLRARLSAHYRREGVPAPLPRGATLLGARASAIVKRSGQNPGVLQEWRLPSDLTLRASVPAIVSAAYPSRTAPAPESKSRAPQASTCMALLHKSRWRSK